MPGRKVLFPMLLLLIACNTMAQTRSWVNPYVEGTTADAGALSLYVVPDGSGPGFTDADNGLPNGSADASIMLTLYDDDPAWGEPLADFPREDIWLMSSGENFQFCPGGTLPDVNTNDNGVTWWTLPPRAGGRLNPDEGDRVLVWVSGWELEAPGLRELRFNSPDLNGDQVINLADVGTFSLDFHNGYQYRSDLDWDGVLNLSDVARLARHVGAACP